MAELVYLTAKTKEEARKIAMALLERRLAAGANIFPLESLYWWQGKICDETEYAVFMQTEKENFGEILNVAKQLHSYEVPCIISLPIERGNADFLAWIKQNTQQSERG